MNAEDFLRATILETKFEAFPEPENITLLTLPMQQSINQELKVAPLLMEQEPLTTMFSTLRLDAKIDKTSQNLEED